MTPRDRLLWLASGLLLGWILLMGTYSARQEECRAAAGVWDWRRLHCRTAPAIELKRELERS